MSAPSASPRRLHLVTLDACARAQHEVRRLLDLHPQRIVAVRTRRQDAGRGRGERVWHSPPQPGLLLSVGMRGAMPVELLDGFVRDVVEALRDALRELAELDAAAIAWSAPNDLVDGASGEKLAGVLVDARSVGDTVHELVTGIGVNVLGGAFTLPDGSRRVATLESVAGRTLDIDERGLDELALRLARSVATRAGLTAVAPPP